MMPFDELERVYERLAQAIDQAGPKATPVLLAKLVLILSDRCGDSTFAIAAIDSCLRNL
jgi:hypothetical protein